MQRLIYKPFALVLGLPLGLMLSATLALAQTGFPEPQSGEPAAAPTGEQPQQQLQRPPGHSPGQFEKIVASSVTPELLEAHVTEEGIVSEAVEVLRTSFELRSNRTRQLAIRVDGECSAWLDAEPENGEPATRQDEPEVEAASVTVWVEVNGEPVSIANNAEVADDGSVVYCNAAGEADLTTLEPGDLIEMHNHARAATGFTWTADGIGQGFHEVVVKARIDVKLADDDEIIPPPAPIEAHTIMADAAAIIGKRTLTVEPTNVIFSEGELDVEI